jgi:cytochrome P450
MDYPLLIFSIVFATWSVFIPIMKLSRNYLKARRIGIRPILITPVSLLGPIWATMGALIGVWIEQFLLALPFGLGSWIKYSGHSWFYKQKYFLHEKYGPVFIIVTPSEIEVVIAEPETATEINRRNMEFPKMEQMYKPLEIFGPSVDTVNGETWQRHRRLTARPFNEKNNIIVWNDAIKQASGMLSSWTDISSNEKGVNSTTPDIMTLALHVLQRAGFGKSFEFRGGGVTKLLDGHSMTYKESLRIILGNLFTSILIDGAAALPSFMMPSWMNEIKTAVGEFRKYMIEMVQEERSKGVEENHLLNVLARLDEKADPRGKTGLTYDEIYGNLFLYNVAGHDTAANTMAAAVFLMATNKHWQDWVREEVGAVLEEYRGEWDYEKLFPKLNRCLAIMVGLDRKHVWLATDF